MAVRIQITLYDKLVAEAVVENYSEACRVWAAYAVAKYKSGKHIGAAAISKLSVPRMFDVPVGEVINV